MELVLPDNKGVIRYYNKEMRPVFVANCKCAHHLPKNTCKIQKAAYVSPLASRKAQGRPLGYLVAWLLKASSAPTLLQHSVVRISLEERKAAREYLKGLVGTHPAAQQLLGCEKPPHGPEPEEAQGGGF